MEAKTNRLISIIKDAKNSYSEDNFVLLIPRFVSKSFTSFCSMREDLILIKEYIRRLKNEEDSILKSALTYSSISLYGKCFTDATNKKAPKLEPKQIFTTKTELLDTHEYLMNLRHNFIAHRGDTEVEVEAAYLLIPKKDGEAQVRYSQLKQMSFHKEQHIKIIELVDFLLDIVMNKIEKTGEKTYSGFLNILDDFTPEQIQFMMVNNIKETNLV